MGAMEKATRIYQFVVTVEVEPGHPAYDDPEWVRMPHTERSPMSMGWGRSTPTSLR